MQSSGCQLQLATYLPAEGFLPFLASLEFYQLLRHTSVMQQRASAQVGELLGSEPRQSRDIGS